MGTFFGRQNGLMQLSRNHMMAIQQITPFKTAAMPIEKKIPQMIAVPAMKQKASTFWSPGVDSGSVRGILSL